MQAERTQFAVRLLPSLTDFAFLAPMGILFSRMGGTKTLLGDCDTGWHIRTGEWILAHRAVPTHDVFSFSKPGGDWYAWEWLSDVLFAGLNSWGGLAAVVLFSILLISFTNVLLFRLVRRKANPLLAIAVTLMAAAVSSIHWLARPHLFTLFFLVLFYFALEEVREGRPRLAGIPYLAILPLATILWTNLHGGFFVGILAIGAYGAGELLAVLFSSGGRTWRPAWQRARALFLSALACLAASLVNPYFYRLHVHMAKYLGDPYNSQHIMEFLSPSFHHPTAIFFEVLLALAVAAAIWNLSQKRFPEALLLLVWAHGALLAARNIPIFAIAAAPAVAAAVEDWFARLPRLDVAAWLRSAAARFNALAADMGETDALGRWHLVSAAAVALVAALLYAPHPPASFRPEFDPKSYPAAALRTLRSDPAARIFTDDEWGDYLIWRLYPGHQVFVDGRSDFYGDDFENKFMDVLSVKYGWEKTLARFGVNTILLPPNAALAGALKESSRWRVVYDDGVALIFRPLQKAAGETISVARAGGGAGRDREVTKTEACDRAITEKKPKT
ncbi:MAG: hypothetical protein LAP87_12365 [Acidobacteriia bacterium]|nr:hypothetical protein [Terriglobia bacterium]